MLSLFYWCASRLKWDFPQVVTLSYGDTTSSLSWLAHRLPKDPMTTSQDRVQSCSWLGLLWVHVKLQHSQSHSLNILYLPGFLPFHALVLQPCSFSSHLVSFSFGFVVWQRCQTLCESFLACCRPSIFHSLWHKLVTIALFILFGN